MPLSLSQPLEPAVDFVIKVLAVSGITTPDITAEVVIEADDPASPGSKAPTQSGSLTWVEAAVEVLLAAGTPLHVREIVKGIVAQDLRSVDAAQTPEATLRRDLRHAISGRRTSPSDVVITQTAPATFKAERVS